jgi:hypothetical protein
MKDKPDKPSVFGKMVVHAEAGLDQICRDIERRKRAGEKFPTPEDHRRLRQKIYGKPEKQ